MKSVDNKIINYLRDKDNHKIDVYKLCLNESTKLPKGTISYRVDIDPVSSPTNRFSSWIDSSKDINYETDKYSYYIITEIPIDVKSFGADKAYYTLRVPKKGA